MLLHCCMCLSKVLETKLPHKVHVIDSAILPQLPTVQNLSTIVKATAIMSLVNKFASILHSSMSNFSHTLFQCYFNHQSLL